MRAITSELVVINSNLATPSYIDNPDALPHPAWNELEVQERIVFNRPSGFAIPTLIQLRLYDGCEEPRETEIRETIRQLGHGVTAYIEADHPNTSVSAHLLDHGVGPQYSRIGWHVAGIATIPQLGVDKIEFRADRVTGHKVHPAGTASEAMLTSLPRGILLR